MQCIISLKPDVIDKTYCVLDSANKHYLEFVQKQYFRNLVLTSVIGMFQVITKTKLNSVDIVIKFIFYLLNKTVCSHGLPKPDYF